jgi:hypothetical protein
MSSRGVFPGTPAQAGIQDIPAKPINKFLDSRLRGNDKGALKKTPRPLRYQTNRNPNSSSYTESEIPNTKYKIPNTKY